MFTLFDRCILKGREWVTFTQVSYPFSACMVKNIMQPWDFVSFHRVSHACSVCKAHLFLKVRLIYGIQVQFSVNWRSQKDSQSLSVNINLAYPCEKQTSKPWSSSCRIDNRQYSTTGTYRTLPSSLHVPYPRIGTVRFFLAKLILQLDPLHTL